LALALALSATGAQGAQKPLRVALIDVEGGAATLFVTPEGKSLLVDTGWPAGMGLPAGAPPAPSSAERIVDAAKRMGLRRIDYLLISHYHLDHVGGAPELLEKFPVGTVIDHGPNREAPPPDQPPSPTQTAQLYARYQVAVGSRPHRVMKPDETLKLGSLSLRFVAGDRVIGGRPASGPPTPGCDTTPSKSQVGGEENPRSLGFVASYGKARILDLADLTWDLEKQLVCPTNRLGRIDLLLVSHHGSDLSNSAPLLAATAPRVALVANGARKGGDRPVLERLKAAPSAPAVWQLHFATRAAEANAPERYIANLDGQPDAGALLEAQVSKDGAVTVVNSRNGARETYRPSDR
jgi:beta-lactamase superfamily II metal-dependent hydrolase